MECTKINNTLKIADESGQALKGIFSTIWILRNCAAIAPFSWG
jgi:hypothetical protein